MEQQQQQKINPTLPIKIMIGYLYFAQGFIISIATTVPYTYKILPDYFTLSLFSLALIPFSLKFITAPLLQKYSNLTYGKRKTWIIISQLITISTILLCSLFTGQNQAKIFALVLLLAIFALSLQDIALDALALKELGDAKLMSMLQASCQSSGMIVGGLILLKFTSEEFGEKIGLLQPITTLPTILITFSLFLIIPTILIHKKYTQTQIPADKKSSKQSILNIYKIYKYFLKKQYRYCRILIFLLIFNQGYNFFVAGYSYQLIAHGFSRDNLNTIQNVQHVIVTILIFVFGTKANYLGFKRTFMLEFCIVGVIYLFLWAFFPTTIQAVTITNILLGILYQWDFLVRTALCAYFPETGATGMLYTMNASIANFGHNLFIHTAILKYIPWRTASMIGIIFQVLLVFIFFPKMIDLIDEGQTQIRFSQTQEGIQLSLKQEKNVKKVQSEDQNLG